MLYRYEKHIGLGPYIHSSHMALTQLMENHSTLMTTLFFPRAPQLQALPHPPEHHQETLHNVPPFMFCKSWPFSFLGFSSGIFSHRVFYLWFFPWRMLGSTLLNRLTPFAPSSLHPCACSKPKRASARLPRC